ncbi:hypothetical protein L596_009473 [Steinernema carpocapsae]|uniref:LRRCT domain-containing protein n=1 Tax=Steinernema carpocapsae TaxID=34508 RepID=A0A4U5PGS6_STECR|nr:hypothetical protein L596_009473 [Steinernema carpocapsae]
MLRRIPSKSLTLLTELEDLDLGFNSFSEIPTSAFEGLSSLKRLSLGHLQSLRAVRLNAFSGLFKLLELDLSHALLDSLDEHAFERPNALRSLDLSFNGLFRVHKELVDWEQLERLQLAGNAWNCDCELLGFLPATLRRLAVPNVVCAKPESMTGKPAAKLGTATFCSDFSEGAMSAVLMGSFLTVLSLLLAILFCLRSHFCRAPKNTDDANSSRASRAPLYGRQARHAHLREIGPALQQVLHLLESVACRVAARRRGVLRLRASDRLRVQVRFLPAASPDARRSPDASDGSSTELSAFQPLRGELPYPLAVSCSHY